MSAQFYLARLVDEGRYDRGLHRASLRHRVLTRRERRRLRALEGRKH